MSAKDSTDFSFIKKLSPQQKRLRNIAPFIVLPVVAIIYFIVDSSKQTSNEQASTIESYVDTELPTSGTKGLGESKLDVYKEYEDFDNERKKQVSSDFDSHLGNPLGTDEAPTTQVVVEKDTVEVNRLKSELARLEFEKNKKLAQNYKRQSSPKTVSHSNTRVTQTNYATQSSSNLDVDDWGDDSGFFDETQVNSRDLNAVNTSKVITKKEGVTDKIIEAVIHNDQEVTNKGRVTLRLKKQARIKGKLYAANTKFYGSVRFLENRVLLSISNIMSNPVNLKAYDKQDGNEGIFLENQNMFSEASKESTESIIDNQNIQGINVGNALKRVFRKRSQVPKVTLLNNYELLLKL